MYRSKLRPCIKIQNKIRNNLQKKIQKKCLFSPSKLDFFLKRKPYLQIYFFYFRKKGENKNKISKEKTKIKSKFFFLKKKENKNKIFFQIWSFSLLSRTSLESGFRDKRLICIQRYLHTYKKDPIFCSISKIASSVRMFTCQIFFILC